ncbi:MAG: trypsin-like peptidase domain-containing protein [Armatimonadetes bacterium]|nr:trypsin-like peptidase domain-containing protein [Armatimonadota bacterium]
MKTPPLKLAMLSMLFGFVGGGVGSYLVVGHLHPTGIPVIDPGAQVSSSQPAVVQNQSGTTKGDDFGGPSEQDAIIRAAEAVNPTVVNIDATRLERQRPSRQDWFRDFFRKDPGYSPTPTQGSGSGFIINPNGYVVTNEHVVRDADKLIVTVGKQKRYTARLVGTDSRTDVAVLKIEGAPDLPTSRLGTSRSLRPGEWVIAIGNPFREFAHTVTVGVVSAVDRPVQIREKSYKNLIQTDAAINMGNSGGPLVNLKGRIVGVNTAIFSPTGTSVGIGFAIPIDKVKEILNDLIREGKVSRPFVGVKVVDVSEGDQKKLRLPDRKGALVTEIMAGGPAEKAGLREQDVVVSYNGRSIESTDQFVEEIQKLKIGDTLRLGILRDGMKRALVVKLAESKE